MYDTNFFILVSVALFNFMLGVCVNTSNFTSAFIFKFAPIVSAIALGLLAFKVI